jgi:ABC-2 type transport system permease protein
VRLRRVAAVASVECSKLSAQLKTRVALAACAAGPFVFAIAMRVQNSLPEDTLFGRSVKESGFAVPLVVLGFAALWVLPVLTSIVGGDVFSAEDRYGTWKTVLTRSCRRSEVFAGKVAAALGFSLLAMTVLAASSLAAGLLVIGSGPLVNLSGGLLPSSRALTRVTLAWISVLPPMFGMTAVAVLLSVATRNSAAGIGLPVVAALIMQLYALIDGPEIVRRLLITSAFGAWHGLLAEPPYHGPLVYGTTVSCAYLVISLAIAYRVLQQRDIAG